MAWKSDRLHFERAVHDALPAALRLAIKLTGSVVAAEDLLQETMLRATRSWPGYRGDANIRTWLYRIMINAHRDLCRKRREYEILPDEIDDTRQVDPVETLSSSELNEAIAAHVSRLPVRQREVLILSVYEGFSTREIAMLLEITEANVYANLYAARTRLKESLAAYLAMQMTK